jgi:putative hydrolase of the HAD superfamily
VWFFDLDNTLHHASPAIFPLINQMMTAYVADKLALSLDAAHALRQAYWARYGATLLGMIRHHDTDPHEFLRESHRFEDLPSLIRAETGLRHLFARLPGQKRLLTNAPHAYAQRILQHIGLHWQLGRGYAIEQMRLHGHYRPKPSRSMLRALVRREQCQPARCVLVDDDLDNLRAARALGMRTVWVSGFLPKPTNGQSAPNQPRKDYRCGMKPQWCDVQVKSVRALPRILAKIRTKVR